MRKACSEDTGISYVMSRISPSTSYETVPLYKHNGGQIMRCCMQASMSISHTVLMHRQVLAKQHMSSSQSRTPIQTLTPHLLHAVPQSIGLIQDVSEEQGGQRKEPWEGHWLRQVQQHAWASLACKINGVTMVPCQAQRQTQQGMKGFRLHRDTDQGHQGPGDKINIVNFLPTTCLTAHLTWV